MKSTSSAVIELRDLHLKTDIGTYGANDTRPDLHLLDLTLGIAVNQVVITDLQPSMDFSRVRMSSAITVGSVP